MTIKTALYHDGTSAIRHTTMTPTSRLRGSARQAWRAALTTFLCPLVFSLVSGTELTRSRFHDDDKVGYRSIDRDFTAGPRRFLASRYQQQSSSLTPTTRQRVSDLRSLIGVTTLRQSLSGQPVVPASANDHARSVPVAVASSSSAADRRRSSADKRLPGAIIVGVKKGGTRALLEYLKLHPDVRAAGREVHFFDRHYRRGLDWYRTEMPATARGQLTVEKTPSYFVTPDVAERVYNMSCDLASASRDHVRLLVVVRDPVTRALSDYAQSAAKSQTYLADFESLAFANRSVVDASWSPIRLGLYSHYVGPWLTRFSPDRVLFVRGERLATDPAAEMASVQRFLGLRPVVGQRNFYFNATKGFPCLRVMHAGAPSDGRGRTRCLGSSKGRRHPVIDVDSLRRLRQFYRPYNNVFYQMTGIEFGWN